MFIGHYGIGLTGKKASSAISLGTLILASQWLDLIWPILLLLGIEHVVINPGDTKMTPLNFTDYPFSHSLIYVLGWCVLVGGIYFIIKRNIKNSIIVGLLVLSHWILDFLVHRPDLPILTGGPNVGLGLWNSPFIAVIIESLIFIAGIRFYLSVTKAKDKIGIYAFWSMIVFLVIIYVMNLTGPPPPDSLAIGYAGLLLWVFVIWGYWIDKHREIFNLPVANK